MGFSRQEYWSGLPCPSPKDFPGPGIKPASLLSPALAGVFFTTSATWESPPILYLFMCWFCILVDFLNFTFQCFYWIKKFHYHTFISKRFLLLLFSFHGILFLFYEYIIALSLWWHYYCWHHYFRVFFWSLLSFLWLYFIFSGDLFWSLTFHTEVAAFSILLIQSPLFEIFLSCKIWLAAYLLLSFLLSPLFLWV